MRFPHIYDYVRISLGHPVVKVELTCSQVEFCVEEAIKKWVQYQGFINKATLIDVQKNINGYDLPNEIRDQKREIIDVVYEPQTLNYDDDTSYLLINQYFYYFSSNKQLMSDYTMFKGYIEDLKRALGIFGTWDIIDNKIYFYPKPRYNLKVMIFYKGLPTDSFIDENQWVMRYALAASKGILGQVRGKFANGLQGPGGNITLNSGDLLQQSAAEKEKLLDELKKRAKPVGIIRG